jgi:protein SCO1/2
MLCAGLTVGVRAQYIQSELPEPARGLDIVERPGNMVPLDTQLVNSEGKAVRLGDSFDQGKPVVLALAYYDCPVACPAVLDAMTRCFNGLDYAIGKDFNVVVVSFNPKNTTMMAADAKRTALGGYSRPKTPQIEAGWRFHTASAEASGAVADAVGFKYRFLPDSGQYSHPIGIFVLTPQGRVSKYFYGFEYPAADMKMALIGASEGKMALTLGDRLVLFCYHYDPKTGTFTFAAYRLMQAGAVVTMVLLAALVALLRGGEARWKRTSMAPRSADPAFPVNASVAALGPAPATQR